MAKAIRKREPKRRGFKDDHLPLTKENFVIIGIGVGVIIAGYIAMLEGSVEGFLPLVLAPILLIIGYCVIVPLGILFRKSYIKAESSPQEQPIRESKAG